MHKTSININQELFELMKETADTMEISVQMLIKMIIARFSKCYSNKLEPTEISISYQQRQQSGWHVFPVSYTNSEYEQCLDIRKIWKMSVSFFLAAAFVHFLQNFECAEEKDNHEELKNSYMLKDYCCQKKLVGKRIVLILIWGKEEKQKPQPET